MNILADATCYPILPSDSPFTWCEGCFVCFLASFSLLHGQLCHLSSFHYVSSKETLTNLEPDVLQRAQVHRTKPADVGKLYFHPEEEELVLYPLERTKTSVGLSARNSTSTLSPPREAGRGQAGQEDEDGVEAVARKGNQVRSCSVGEQPPARKHLPLTSS